MSVKHSIRIFFIFIIALVYTGSLTAQERRIRKTERASLFSQTLQPYRRDVSEEFIELNKGKLGKNNTLRMGVKYTLPPLASAPQKKNYQPIRQVASQLQSNLFRFKGSLLLSVSGHGGPDPGRSVKWAPMNCMRMNTLTTSCYVWHAIF